MSLDHTFERRDLPPCQAFKHGGPATQSAVLTPQDAERWLFRKSISDYVYIYICIYIYDICIITIYVYSHYTHIYIYVQYIHIYIIYIYTYIPSVSVSLFFLHLSCNVLNARSDLQRIASGLQFLRPPHLGVTGVGRGWTFIMQFIHTYVCVYIYIYTTYIYIYIYMYIYIYVWTYVCDMLIGDLILTSV